MKCQWEATFCSGIILSLLLYIKTCPRIEDVPMDAYPIYLSQVMLNEIMTANIAYKHTTAVCSYQDTHPFEY